MDATFLAVVSTIAFAVTVLAMLVLRPAAFAVGLLDHPGGHKTHEGVVPIVGGAAMLAGLVVAALLDASLARHGVLLILVGAALVVVGAIDDRFGLPPLTRLYAHLLAAITLVFGTGFFVDDLGNLFGTGVVDLSWLGPVFTVVACVALVNAFNMLDGLDGLAGSCGLVAATAFAVISVAVGAPTAAAISAGLAGAIAGFLLFNVPVALNRPLRTFMGDGGSTLLGFGLASLALTLVQTDRADVSPVLVLWIVTIPIFELFATTGRRLLRGVSPLEPDNGHFHHLLLRAGLPVRAVFVLYFVSSAATAAFALWAHRQGVPDPLLFMGFGLAFLAWMGFVHNARRFISALPRLFGRPATITAG